MSEKLPLHQPSPTAAPSKRAPLARLLLAGALISYIAYTSLATPNRLGDAALSIIDNLQPVPASLKGDKGASCPVQYDFPGEKEKTWNPEEDKEYVEMAVEKLRGAVRIPTESFDDMASDPSQEPRFEIMSKLHSFLASSFPLVHSSKLIKLEKVATYGLLYTFAGTDSSLKPIVLMAHQDVVPVNKASLDRWTHPPFEAHVDGDGWIWGRGVADCKNTLVGILSALEKLVEEGFEPKRTVVLSFGFDEEIGGRRSARPLSETLLSRYGHNGIALILDEGFTGVDYSPEFNTTFARLGMAEKGAVSVKLEVLTPGGHSSVPPKHTGIGVMSKLIVALEDSPDSPKLERGNPVLSYLNCAADHGSMSKSLKRSVRNPKRWKKLGEEMAEGDETGVTRAFLATTQAADLIGGGIKVNALPEYVTSTINYRISFLSSVSSTLSHISSVLTPSIHALNLTFDNFGSHSHVNNSVVRLSVVERSEIEPAPLTPSEGGAWRLMSGTIREQWKEAVVAPSGMVANTDTKWTWDLTPHIYRFVPAPLALLKNFHTVDERIHKDAHISVIKFYHSLLRNSERWEGDD